MLLSLAERKELRTRNKLYCHLAERKKKKGKKELGFFFFLKLKRKELSCHFTFTISLRCLESKGDAVVYFKILGDWF